MSTSRIRGINWNDMYESVCPKLPGDITSAPSLPVFQRKLKINALVSEISPMYFSISLRRGGLWSLSLRPTFKVRNVVRSSALLQAGVHNGRRGGRSGSRVQRAHRRSSVRHGRPVVVLDQDAQLADVLLLCRRCHRRQGLEHRLRRIRVPEAVRHVHRPGIFHSPVCPKLNEKGGTYLSKEQGNLFVCPCRS